MAYICPHHLLCNYDRPGSYRRNPTKGLSFANVKEGRVKTERTRYGITKRTSDFPASSDTTANRPVCFAIFISIGFSALTMVSFRPDVVVTVTATVSPSSLRSIVEIPLEPTYGVNDAHKRRFLSHVVRPQVP